MGIVKTIFRYPTLFFCIDIIPPTTSQTVKFAQEIWAYDIGKYNAHGIRQPDSPPVKFDLPQTEYFSSFHNAYDCMHISQNGSFYVAKVNDFWEIAMSWRIYWKATEASMDDALELLDQSLLFIYVNFANTEMFDMLAAPTTQHMTLEKSGIIHGSKKTPFYKGNYQFDSFVPILPIKNCTNKPGYLCAFAEFGIFYSVPRFTVQTVNLETNLQLAKRIITDICSLTGAVGMVSIILFSRIISKIILPNDQTFLIPHDTREAALHLINKSNEKEKDKRDKKRITLDIGELDEVDDHFGPTDPLIST